MWSITPLPWSTSLPVDGILSQGVGPSGSKVKTPRGMLRLLSDIGSDSRIRFNDGFFLRMRMRRMRLPVADSCVYNIIHLRLKE